MNADDFSTIPSERERSIRDRLNGEPFATLVGFAVEEVRADYARCVLPFRPALHQGAGLIHGGAISALLDHVAIGATLSAWDAPPRKLVTLSLSIHLIDAVADETLVAEARVRRRGRRITFLDVAAHTAGGREIAHAEIVAAVEAGAPEEGDPRP